MHQQFYLLNLGCLERIVLQKKLRFWAWFSKQAINIHHSTTRVNKQCIMTSTTPCFAANFWWALPITMPRVYQTVDVPMFAHKHQERNMGYRRRKPCSRRPRNSSRSHRQPSRKTSNSPDARWTLVSQSDSQARLVRTAVASVRTLRGSVLLLCRTFVQFHSRDWETCSCARRAQRTSVMSAVKQDCFSSLHFSSFLSFCLFVCLSSSVSRSPLTVGWIMVPEFS